MTQEIDNPIRNRTRRAYIQGEGGRKGLIPDWGIFFFCSQVDEPITGGFISGIRGGGGGAFTVCACVSPVPRIIQPPDQQ